MDADLFDAEIGARRLRAELLFSGQRVMLRTVAQAMASSHPRAIDYIEQAPIIVLLAWCGFSPLTPSGFKFSRDMSTLGKVASSFTGLCQRGPKLREALMHYVSGNSIGAAPLAKNEALPGLYQLRRIKGAALRRAHTGTLLTLARLEPSTLAQIIPAGPAIAQEQWLAFLTGWRYRMAARAAGPFDLTAFEDLARAVSSTRHLAVHQAEHVADYCVAMQRDGAPPPLRSWTWGRLAREAAAWGNGQPAVTGFAFDFEADYTPLPNGPVEFDGFTFVPLRSGAALAGEGRVMRHCVGNYAHDVAVRRCFIFSARKGDERVATLEIRLYPSARISMGDYRNKLEARIFQCEGYRRTRVFSDEFFAARAVFLRYCTKAVENMLIVRPSLTAGP